MWRWLILFILIVLVACSPLGINKQSMKNNIYEDSWNGEALIVEQNDGNGQYDVINEITDEDEIEQVIKQLKKSRWKESVDVDIRMPDYTFNLNGYTHNLWMNEKGDQFEFNINEISGFGSFSKKSSAIIYDLLINNH